jgi:hypothetical protein
MNGEVTIRGVFGVAPGDFIMTHAPSGRSLLCRVTRVVDGGHVTIRGATLGERAFVWLRNLPHRILPSRAWRWWVTR